MSCQWKNCSNNILMDDFCSRHLKQKCSICWENVPSTNSAKHKRLSCGHSFHFDCISKWYIHSNECPTCRKPQTNDNILRFKKEIEKNLRIKYRNAIRSLEKEVRQLRKITN